ncbi:MAG: LPP20 family lipoprotein [Tenuifilaceae bacterium]|nr:LPP20 family lipoprotein [Tenuifilaceae bacterium]
MKRIIFVIIVLTPLLLMCRVAGSQTPDWINNPPSKRGFFVATGVGSSANISVAQQKALLDAHVNLAKQVEPEVTTETTRLANALNRKSGLKPQVKVIRKSVTANLEDVRTVEKYTSESKGIHTVYVLVEMPKKAISRSIVTQINNDDELTPIIHPNNCCLRQRLSFTTNFAAQNWVQLSRGNPHLHSSLTNLMNNAG